MYFQLFSVTLVVYFTSFVKGYNIFRLCFQLYLLYHVCLIALYVFLTMGNKYMNE